ncbi:TolC family protein [Chitinophaga silvisoli]|uniref:TolC family protein n=1 Tax=Chitinophaga silvisoli TaxID=2291814 RepID=A0A3E1NU06_9BACT|nr:TolC family protein [Chitinophaga silvisoli]RFM31400.1 TolC family protein [Chitinophaga silvisoli]
MIRYAILIFCLLIDLATTAQVRWDLATCIAFAKKNNIQVNTQRYNQQTAMQNYSLSRSAQLPSVSGSASQYFQKDLRIGSYIFNAGFTLYQGGYLRKDKRQKQLALEAANQSVLVTENDITLNIIQYYLNILLDKEAAVYQQNVVNTSKAQLEQGEQKLAVGSVARKDVTQLRSQLANDEYTLISAENTIKQDLLSLKQLLQLSSEVQFDIATPDTVISQREVPSLATVQEYAFNNRPEIKENQLQIQVAQLGLAKAKSAYYPTLSLSGTVGSSYINDLSGLGSGFYQQAGITLSIPIYSKRQNKTSVETARINIGQAMINLKDTKTTLAANIEKYYLNTINAQSQFTAAREAFKYNEEVYNIANQELALGVSNMVEYLQQKELYVQALQQFIQAKYNAALTIKIYEFYYNQQ